MPDGWTTATIGAVAEVVGGSTPPTAIRSYWDGGIPWITPSEVTRQEGGVITETDRTISPDGLAVIGGRLLPAGTVLLTSRATVGAVALAGVSMAVNQGFAALIAGQQVDPSWLMFWCQAHRADFEALAGGSTYPEVSKPKVREVPIDLPPLADQRRIVDLLASLDGVIRSSEQLVVSIDAAGSSLRQAIFAADTTDVLPLGELCVPGGIQIGPFGSQLHARDYVTDGIPVVMPRDMIDGAISEDHVSRVSPADASRLARHRLEPGDVLLARRGDLTKRAFVLDEQRGWLCGTGSVRVRVTKVAPEVVFEALSTPETNRWLADHAVGITLPNLNTDIVSGIPVRLPTNPEASVRAIADMRACRALAERHARAARFLRASLVQDLFSGTTEIPASYDRFLDGAA